MCFAPQLNPTQPTQPNPSLPCPSTRYIIIVFISCRFQFLIFLAVILSMKPTLHLYDNAGVRTSALSRVLRRYCRFAGGTTPEKKADFAFRMDTGFVAGDTNQRQHKRSTTREPFSEAARIPTVPFSLAWVCCWQRLLHCQSAGHMKIEKN